MHLDAGNQLHREDGPAIAYPDGWSIYAWHGICVPAEWINQRETLDPAEVMSQRNVELRAAGASIIGPSRMASHLDLRVLDGDPTTALGALVELRMPGLPEPALALQAMCPRNGQITEYVARTNPWDGDKPITTAIQAQAWRGRESEAEFRLPTLRT